MGAEILTESNEYQATKNDFHQKNVFFLEDIHVDCNFPLLCSIKESVVTVVSFDSSVVKVTPTSDFE